MFLDNKKLLHEFYVEIGDDYPELNLSQIKEIAFFPFTYLHNLMQGGSLDSMRLKYFGIFKVYGNRIKGLYNKLDTQLKKGNITKERYEYLENMLSKHIKQQK